MLSLSTIYGVPGISRAKVRIRGRSGAVGTSYELVNPYGTDRELNTILATASALDVTSSDAADAAAGTGARTIRVFGLNAAYQPVSEDFTMNGQTAVTGSVAFLRVHGATVLTAGSGLVNAGDIYVVVTGSSTWTSGVPDTLTSSVMKILAGYGEDMMGCWTSPAGAQYKLVKLIVGGRGDSFALAMVERKLSGGATTKVARIIREWDSFTTGPVSLDISDIPPIASLSDIKFMAKAASGTALVSVEAIFEKQ